MRSSADIYKEYLADKIINDDELAALQRVGVKMLSDFHEMCDKAGIRYWLAYGTFLGAVRHKGYIPWDDDLDVFVMEDDMTKLRDIIANEYSDRYYILDHDYDKQYNIYFPKLIMKDTVLVEAYADNKKMKHGIFLDLFTIGRAPKRGYGLKNKWYVLTSRLSSLTCDFRYPSRVIRERAKIKGNEELKSYYNKRRFMGFFAGIFPVGFWCFMRKIGLRGKRSNDYVVYSDEGLLLIDEGLIDAERTLYDFGGKQFYSFKDYNRVLTAQYGDTYMQLPPEDKRYKHIIVELDLSKVISKLD